MRKATAALLASLWLVFASCASRSASRWSYDDLKPDDQNSKAISTSSIDFCPPAPHPHRLTRAEALEMLRTLHILSPHTEVVSVTWLRSDRAWLVTLLHPAGGRTHWRIGADFPSVEGGTEVPKP